MKAFFLYYGRDGKKVTGQLRNFNSQFRGGLFKGRTLAKKVSFLIETGVIVEKHERLPKWWKDPLAAAIKFSEWDDSLSTDKDYHVGDLWKQKKLSPSR